MRNKNIQNLLSTTTVIFIVLCVAYFYFYKQINKNIKLTEKIKVDLQEEISKREEIKDFNDSFKLIEQDKNLFETHFVQKSNVVPFLNKIEDMAKSVGVEVEVSSIEISSDNTGLLVQIKSSGTFSKIYKLINLLENSPYELEFNSVYMYSEIGDGLNKKGGVNLWQADFNIKLISFI